MDRWDIQRARSLREHEELLRKYKLKGASGQGQKERKAKEKVATFESKLYEGRLTFKRTLSAL